MVIKSTVESLCFFICQQFINGTEIASIFIKILVLVIKIFFLRRQSHKKYPGFDGISIYMPLMTRNKTSEPWILHIVKKLSKINKGT